MKIRITRSGYAVLDDVNKTTKKPTPEQFKAYKLIQQQLCLVCDRYKKNETDDVSKMHFCKRYNTYFPGPNNVNKCTECLISAKKFKDILKQFSK